MNMLWFTLCASLVVGMPFNDDTSSVIPSYETSVYNPELHMQYFDINLNKSTLYRIPQTMLFQDFQEGFTALANDEAVLQQEVKKSWFDLQNLDETTIQAVNLDSFRFWKKPELVFLKKMISHVKNSGSSVHRIGEIKKLIVNINKIRKLKFDREAILHTLDDLHNSGEYNVIIKMNNITSLDKPPNFHRVASLGPVFARMTMAIGMTIVATGVCTTIAFPVNPIMPLLVGQCAILLASVAMADLLLLVEIKKYMAGLCREAGMMNKLCHDDKSNDDSNYKEEDPYWTRFCSASASYNPNNILGFNVKSYKATEKPIFVYDATEDAALNIIVLQQSNTTIEVKNYDLL